MKTYPRLVVLLLVIAACGSGGPQPTAPGGPRSPSLSIAIAPNPLAYGTSAQASATITDASGNTSPAIGVTWLTTNRSIADISVSGLVTGAGVGTATITATSGGVTGQTQLIITPGAPAHVTIYSGDAQVAANGSQLSAPLCVVITDAGGNVVPGAVATFTVTSGGGTMALPTAPAADAFGIATSGLWRLGSQIGVQTVSASVSGAGSVTFHATAQ